MTVVLIFYFLFQWIWDGVIRGKRHEGLKQRLGLGLPDSRGRNAIWIHAVSVGEVKGAGLLLQALKEKIPEAFFLITTTTETGQKEAKRLLTEADAVAYFPLDLPFVVRRWTSHFRPRWLILIEGDVWPHLVREVKRQGGKTFLVSGKLSERSFRRLQWIPFLGRKLFDPLDLLLVQSETYRQRFVFFADPKRIFITGNLKFDLRSQPVDISFWRGRLMHPAVTLASTHFPEEEMLLEVLNGGLSNAVFFLAPRHPERVDAVANFLQRSRISCVRWSSQSYEGERVILVDAMGHLPTCYTLSRLSIVGGSFVHGIGGHNILEPCLYGSFVFFGPWMEGQAELVTSVVEAGAGKQLCLEDLLKRAMHILQEDEESLRARVWAFSRRSGGVLEKTLARLPSFSK